MPNVDNSSSRPSLTLGSGSTPTLSMPGPGSDSPSKPHPFAAVKSSISRKKPLGLDISRSIPKPASRGASIITTGPDSAVENDGGSVSWVPEADRLRDEIARLQLSSRSSSSSFASGPESPTAVSPVQITPTATVGHAPSASSTPSAGLPPPRPPRRQHTSSEAVTTLSQTTATCTTIQGPSAERHTSSSSGSTRKKHSNGKRKKHDDDLVKDEDLEVLSDLGAGNGGTVTKVWNKKRKCVMAKKLILVDAKPSVRKQILRELQIMNDCSSPYIVGYYGCFPVDVHVGIVMEFMDLGSLDYIYRQTGAVPINIVGKVAEAVLRGLVYLYDVHRIIHRDIKPSNILANSQGQIKICDFGVSGELINSIANTFVGTSTYMSPERIQGEKYTIKSDVWSVGISLVELAQGRFPFADPVDSDSESGYDEDVNDTFDPDATLPLSSQRPNLSAKRHRKRGVSLGGGGMTMSILDLLQHIVNEPAPRLVNNKRFTFPEEAITFVDNCLDKDPVKRASPQSLLESDWIRNSTVTQEDLKAWAEDVSSQLKQLK